MQLKTLGFVAFSMLTVGLVGCPEPLDRHVEGEGGESGDDTGGTKGGTGGKTGTGGKSGDGTGGSEATGGKGTGGSSDTGGSGGGSSGGTGGTSSGGTGGTSTGGSGGGKDAGVDMGTTAGAVSLKTDLAPTLSMICGKCHTPAKTEAGIYKWLTGAPDKTCAAAKKVTDVIVSKIDPAGTPKCGTRMPKDNPANLPMAAEFAKKVGDWITAGAMDN
jgi:hypothetical protein